MNLAAPDRSIDRQRFRIVRRLARGGMAEVLLAEQVGASGFRRHVVLKRILPHLARQPEYVAMLLDEARITGSLNHPNIAHVFDVVQWQGHQFLVMEYLHGKTVGQLISKARRADGLAVESALSIIGRAAHGLHAAHECKTANGEPLGVVHRDVSPSNVFVTFDGHVKVLDFGIALASSRTTETASGVLKGKVAYMSPEQCRGDVLDRRSDVYALGVLLFEILTLSKLRDEVSDFEAMQKIVEGRIEPPSSRDPSIPRALDQVVTRALALDRDQRYSSCAELAVELEEAGTASGLHPCSSLRIAAEMVRLFGDEPPAWDEDAEIEEEEPVLVSRRQKSAIIEGLGPDIEVGADLEATSVTIERSVAEGPARAPSWRFPLVVAVAVLLLGAGFGGLWAWRGGSPGEAPLEPVPREARSIAPAESLAPAERIVTEKEPVSPAGDDALVSTPVSPAPRLEEESEERRRERRSGRRQDGRRAKPSAESRPARVEKSTGEAPWDPNSFRLPAAERTDDRSSKKP